MCPGRVELTGYPVAPYGLRAIDGRAPRRAFPRRSPLMAGSSGMNAAVGRLRSQRDQIFACVRVGCLLGS